MAIDYGWSHFNELDGFFGKVLAIVFVKTDGSWTGMITAWLDSESAQVWKEGILFGETDITFFLSGFDAAFARWQHTQTLPKPTTFAPPPTPEIIPLQPTNVPEDLTITDATYNRTTKVVSFTLNGVPASFNITTPV